MKKYIYLIVTTFIALTVPCFGEPTHTLKKYGTVCDTKEQWEVCAKNSSKEHLMYMVFQGGCRCNMSGAEVPVEILDGIMTVKIKYQWGDETYIGWTDIGMLEERK